MTELLISGWKSISMVDVYRSVTFTLWLCGCNLKCPFCHNWRIASRDMGVCKEVEIDEIVEEISTAKPLVDYLHVTGGEPLIQYCALSELFRKAHGLGLPTSLNSNLTIVKALEKILGGGLVDHIATDIKTPHRLLYGLETNIADRLWKQFLKSLRLVADHNIPLELRIPVPNTSIHNILRELHQPFKILEKHGNLYVILQPLLSEPVVDPRDKEWCKKYCNPPLELIEELKNHIKEDFGVEKTFVSRLAGF